MTKEKTMRRQTHDGLEEKFDGMCNLDFFLFDDFMALWWVSGFVRLGWWWFGGLVTWWWCDIVSVVRW
jgi:hypothetical protein